MQRVLVARPLCRKSFKLGFAFGAQWVHNGYMDTMPIHLTRRQADFLYGLLQQRLYRLHAGDPERDVVTSTCDAVYPLTSAAARADEVADELRQCGLTVSERIRVARAAGDDHSASRHVDVLTAEAPHLIAPDPFALRQQP